MTDDEKILAAFHLAVKSFDDRNHREYLAILNPDTLASLSMMSGIKLALLYPEWCRALLIIAERYENDGEDGNVPDTSKFDAIVRSVPISLADN